MTQPKPGRELDAEIARKVMGFADARIVGALGAVYDFTGTQEMPLKYVPNYSTDIAAAWTVVEKIKTPERTIEISAPMGDTHWVCQIFKDGKILGGAGADTPALAICKAALKAVNHDKA